MKKFRSVRPYPITLLNGNKQVVLYPGQEIELPEQFGLAHSGLLIPVYDHIKQEVKIVVPKIEEPRQYDLFEEEQPISILEEYVEEVETVIEEDKEEVEEKIEISDVFQEVKEKIVRKAGRPKKIKPAKVKK